MWSVDRKRLVAISGVVQGMGMEKRKGDGKGGIEGPSKKGPGRREL
jgi:hypothetical protein